MQPIVTFQTAKRKINELRPWDKNPRKISDRQKEELKRSINTFDLVEIPVINQDGTIIAGHQRVATMLAMGRGAEEIDVRVPDRMLTEAEIAEYNIRSNKNTGEFDFDKLATNFTFDALIDFGFSGQELSGLDTPDKPTPADEPTKRITLKYNSADYDVVMAGLEKMRTEFSLQDISEAVKLVITQLP